MAKYLFGYHGGGGMAESDAEMEASMAKWGAWFQELGDSVLDGGAPVGRAMTVASDGSVADGGGTSALGGYSIVSANSIEEAVSKAKGSPALEDGGSVQVAELIDM
ncbi:MAG: hypothetical protein M3132_14685 [Actinomycetia bacterium]|nr:hypothetical protein [Actinomycetes bacterium]